MNKNKLNNLVTNAKGSRQMRHNKDNLINLRNVKINASNLRQVTKTGHRRQGDNSRTNDKTQDIQRQVITGRRQRRNNKDKLTNKDMPINLEGNRDKLNNLRQTG